MNPIGLIVGLLTAGATAYFLYSKEIDSATKNQRILNDLKVESQKNILSEISELSNLLIIARDENQSKENRLKAIKSINEISPEYLGNLTLEKINTLEAKGAIDDYIVSLEKMSFKKALEARRSKANEDLLAAKSDKEKRQYGGFFQGKDTDFKEIYENEQKALKDGEKIFRVELNWNRYKIKAYEEYKKGIQEAKDELNFLAEEEKKFIANNANLYVTGNGNNDPNKPKEDDVKYEGKNQYLFKGGKWVYQKPTGGGSGDGKTEEEKEAERKAEAIKKSEKEITDFIAAQKQKRLDNTKSVLEQQLAEIDNRYKLEIEKAGTNHELVKQLEAQRDLEKSDLKLQRSAEAKAKMDEWIALKEEEKAVTEEEKEILRLEKEQEKHIQELERIALNEKEKAQLIELITDQGKIKLQNIRDKYNKKELADKRKLTQDILNESTAFVGGETRLGQALLAIKGIMAAKESLINLGLLKTKVATNIAGATGDIAAGAAKTAKVGFPQNIPLLIGFAAQVGGIISAIKGAASPKGATMSGFEEGLYPVQREQDGKMFNAQFGGNTKSGIVNKPTMFLAGENGPELIVDSKAFKQMNPDIRDSFQREIARVKGFETGMYQQKTFSPTVAPSNTNVSSGNDNNLLLQEAINVIRENKEMMQSLRDEGITAYMSNDLKNGKRLKEVIEDYDTLRNKNKR